MLHKEDNLLLMDREERGGEGRRDGGMEEENPDIRKDDGWTRGMQQAAKLEDVQHKYLWMDDGGMMSG